MRSLQPSVVRNPGDFFNLFLRPPLLTSTAAQWQNITLIHMHQPAHELPEFCTLVHGISIFTKPGVVKRTIDGVSHINSISRGSVSIFPANVGHSAHWEGEREIIVMGLDPALFTAANQDTINFNPIQLVPQSATLDPLVYQLGLSLKTVLEQNPTGSRLYAETAAAMLTVHLLQHYGQRKPEFKDYTDRLPRSTLCQVTEYIQAHLNQELGLSELAAIAHLSPHYFARLFKQSTGVTPHQFVIRCRVERAKTLLLNGQGSIAQIAQQVGFANQGHLTVHIKRLLGVTPKMILDQRKNR